MSWEETSIDELSHIPLRNGIYKGKEFQGSGAKIINMKELFAYDFIGGQDMKRLELNASEKEKFLVKNGDLIFARRSVVAEGAGKTSIIKDLEEEMTFESSMIRVRLNTKYCDPLFYYYYFTSHLGRSQVLSLSTGVNIKGIKGSSLKELLVPKPELSTQHKIAVILSAYDALIENNLKRIKLLEEAALHLYKEWFVNFRFPGIESNTINKETGLPEGWVKKELKDISKVGSSKRVFLSDYVSNGIPFYRGKEITQKANFKETPEPYYISTEKFKELEQKSGIPREGDILITGVGTIGNSYRVTDTDGDFYFKDGNLLWIRDLSFEHSIYLINYLKSIHFTNIVKSISIGSSQKAITINSLKKVQIILPDNRTLNLFSELVNPMLKQMNILFEQKEKLKEARDLLLNRCMNRTIDV